MAKSAELRAEGTGQEGNDPTTPPLKGVRGMFFGSVRHSLRVICSAALNVIQ
jgi:hypothetical protein